MTRKQNGRSRRDFLKGAVFAAAGAVGFPYIVPSCALGKDANAAASERIALGFIAVGLRAKDHVRSALGSDNAQVVAVCDPYKSRREEVKGWVDDHYTKTKGKGIYKSCEAYNDFRELLARKDIDAVVIASPQHWHALHMTASAKAGKDIYGEKAISRTVAEGRAVCDAVRRYGRVFQVGTQQRSDRRFRFACELAVNGCLGKVHTVEVAVPRGSKVPAAPECAVPEGFDYDMWLGPAPFVPYNKFRTNSIEFSEWDHPWYHISDYCTGWITAWGVHHLDIVLWGCPSLYKDTLEVKGTAVFGDEGQGDTSLTWRVEYVTKDGLRCSFSDNGHHQQGCKFIGDKGWVYVNRGGIQAEPESLLTVQLKPEDKHLYESNDHWRNFLDCVRSRKEPAAPIEAGHRATTMGNIADIATRCGRKLVWDWKKEQFTNDEDANNMLSRAMRSPWRL